MLVPTPVNILAECPLTRATGLLVRLLHYRIRNLWVTLHVNLRCGDATQLSLTYVPLPNRFASAFSAQISWTSYKHLT
ncbi:MAG: hypothetical protein QMC95_00790 [Desulfitobacteriaceae bacterium]|nr:hypothetical protein [Desulfitobacteriaceae bacterium]MDI6877861.1 hypothetical protein [Desulfitobacteriaceae bacterium]MDI6912738.1 hypothetical protein [Desulfitobacteriaceae bacterium]